MAHNPHDDLPVPKSVPKSVPTSATSRPPRAPTSVPDAETLVEVYRTDNEIGALFVRDEILGPVGIYAVLHNRRSSTFMAPASMPGEIGLAVPSDQADGARDRLKVARKDGVLVDGDLVEESVA